MNRNKSLEVKADYLNSLNKKLKDIKSKFNSIRGKKDSRKNQDNEDLQKKYVRLKDCIKQFEWQINHFNECENCIDDLIIDSFDTITEEIYWRIDEVELAMKGKELWEEDRRSLLKKGVDF